MAELSDRFQAARGTASLPPPSVSVSRLAREHGIHVNLLFRWRHHYRAGLLSVVPTTPPALLSVTIPDAPASPTARTCRIEIGIANAIVRIDGAADAATVRAVLREVRAWLACLRTPASGSSPA